MKPIAVVGLGLRRSTRSAHLAPLHTGQLTWLDLKHRILGDRAALLLFLE